MNQMDLWGMSQIIVTSCLNNLSLRKTGRFIMLLQDVIESQNMAVCKDDIPLYNTIVTSLTQVVCTYKLCVLH